MSLFEFYRFIYLNGFIMFANLLLVIIAISLERKNPTSALAWLFFMAMFPGIGFLFYILLSQNIAKRKIFKYTREEEELYGMSLDSQRKTFEDGAFSFHEKEIKNYIDMIMFHNRLSDSFYTDANDITIYTNGRDKFDALLEAINNATEHIHLLYYIVKSDAISSEVFEACMAKAREGVEVRLLVDHVGGRSIKKSHIKKLKQSGCQVAFFFPSKFKFFNLKANYRNHRKIAVIDGQVGFVGGYNIGEEYLGNKKRFGHWRDTHLRIIGEAVLQLQVRFLLDWRVASHKKVDNIYDYFVTPIPSKTKAGIQIVSSGPDNINQQIKQGYIKMINSAKKYIYIQTPYFVPDESILEALKIAAVSGVDVRVMFPNKPDHIFVYWCTHSFIGELLEYGIKAYIYDNGFIHAKAIMVDDVISSVGTCNFDIRSFRLNFEVNAFIYDKGTSCELRKTFDQDIHVSRTLTLDDYKNRSFIIRIKEAISRLFAPIL